ncbi:MAG: hypothetical protein ABW137_32850 [Mycobacterium sp.]
MTVVSDPSGIQWNLKRRWWPFWDVADLLDLGDFFGWLGLLLAAPFLLVWPFWLLSKALGARWRIVIERDHEEVDTELVRGWRRSTARINDLALEIAQGRRSGHFVI